MDIIMVPLIKVLLLAVHFFQWALILYAIIRWLISFNILNSHSVIVYRLYDMVARLINPPLSFLRSFVPKIGIVDLSFFVLFLSLIFIAQALERIALRF